MCPHCLALAFVGVITGIPVIKQAVTYYRARKATKLKEQVKDVRNVS